MALIRTYGYWIFVFVAVLIYILFAYDFQRTEHLNILLSFGILTAVSLLLYKSLKKRSWVLLFAIGLGFRLTFLVATPRLSDDFFRFLWDGELNKDGYSAFAFVPSQYGDHVLPEHREKYAEMLEQGTSSFPEGMNSKNYYSIYPTVNQFVFFTSAFGNDPHGVNLILLRIWILIAEIASFFLLRSILQSKQRSYLAGLYWLHPLVITELTGNLHMEALAVTFVLLALYLARRNAILGTGMAIALGVMTKLTPLLMLGAMLKQFRWEKWLAICGVTGILSVGLFSLIVNLETFANFKESIGLFFAWFSFNSGVFYGLRDITLWISGENITAWLSLFFPFISAAIMFYWTFSDKRDMANTALLLFTTYFLFTPILHPWYITVLIPLALLSGMIYPLVWSVLIFGSYLAYGDSFQEPLWWIYIEFAVVISIMILELRKTPDWLRELREKLYA